MRFVDSRMVSGLIPSSQLLGEPINPILQTLPAAHTHQAQVTPKPVSLRRLRETSEAAAVVIEGIGPGQEAGQEPGGHQQQQEQPWGGCQGPKSQPGQAQLQHPAGQTEGELLRPRMGWRWGLGDRDGGSLQTEGECQECEGQGQEWQGW